MSLFRRFQSARPGSHLHSSGMVGDSSKIGATSAESFAQRQQISKNRQFVGAYQDAGVLHNYQKSAQESIVASKSQNVDDTDDTHHHKKHHRSQVIPRTSRIDNRPTSRIENPRTSRVDTPNRSQPVPIERPRASFSEPTSRRYNPFS